MRAILRTITVGLVACFSAGGCGRPADPPLTIDRAERDLGSVPVGEHAVTFDIHNPSSTPRRVLGVADGCRGTVCFLSRHRDVLTIGAGETFRYATELTLRSGGPFESSIEVYLEDSGTRAVTLSVRGVATEAPP